MSYKTGLNIKTFEASAAKVGNYTFSGTFTQTHILVTGKGGEYEEPAISIDTSIYPRFPEDQQAFKSNFIQFIGYLATTLKQERVAIHFSDESLMLETEYCTKPDLK